MSPFSVVVSDIHRAMTPSLLWTVDDKFFKSFSKICIFENSVERFPCSVWSIDCSWSTSPWSAFIVEEQFSMSPCKDLVREDKFPWRVWVNDSNASVFDHSISRRPRRVCFSDDKPWRLSCIDAVVKDKLWTLPRNILVVNCSSPMLPFSVVVSDNHRIMSPSFFCAVNDKFLKSFSKICIFENTVERFPCSVWSIDCSCSMSLWSGFIVDDKLCISFCKDWVREDKFPWKDRINDSRFRMSLWSVCVLAEQICMLPLTEVIIEKNLLNVFLESFYPWRICFKASIGCKTCGKRVLNNSIHRLGFWPQHFKASMKGLIFRRQTLKVVLHRYGCQGQVVNIAL